MVNPRGGAQGLLGARMSDLELIHSDERLALEAVVNLAREAVAARPTSRAVTLWLLGEWLKVSHAMLAA